MTKPLKHVSYDPDEWWIAPIEATEGMHAAARDWSIRKYDKAVGKDGSAGCYKAMRLAAPAPQGWQCKAKPTADPPQECGWPTCGCDPYADKVINALDEMGAFAPAPPQWQPDEAIVERLARTAFDVHRRRAKVNVFPWELQDECDRDDWRAGIRAALAAIPEGEKK